MKGLVIGFAATPVSMASEVSRRFEAALASAGRVPHTARDRAALALQIPEKSAIVRTSEAEAPG
jgi:hypothetical protein